MNTARLILSAALVAAAVAAPAAAERAGDKFWLDGGVFFSNVDSTLQVNNVALGIDGTKVDLEKDLGLQENQTLPYGLIGVRLSRNFRLEGEYLKLGRSGDVLLSRSITIGDTVYDATAGVATDFDTQIFRVVLGYSFVHHDNLELGASLGFHITKFSFDISGYGSVNGLPDTLAYEQHDQLAPLPTIGFYGNYEFSKIFSVYGRLDFLSLKISDYKGTLIDAQGGVQARLLKNLGIGAGYRYVDYGLDVRKSDWNGSVDYNFKGPVLFVELAF